jgi:predicted DNA-binding ribbon-helix-helix protein
MGERKVRRGRPPLVRGGVVMRSVGLSSADWRWLGARARERRTTVGELVREIIEASRHGLVIRW